MIRRRRTEGRVACAAYEQWLEESRDYGDRQEEEDTDGE